MTLSIATYALERTHRGIIKVPLTGLFVPCLNLVPISGFLFPPTLQTRLLLAHTVAAYSGTA